MERFAGATDLLDEGLRFYRHHALALLGFALGPALAMALIVTTLVRFFSTRSRPISGWVVLPVSLLVCFPLLVFLALGVLHAVAADEPPLVRRMAGAALDRLGQRVGLALAALLPMLLVTLVAANTTAQLVEGFGTTIESALRSVPGLPWLFVQFCVDGLDMGERFVGFTLGVLAILLPCAGVLYLLQHRIRRLPQPSGFGQGGLARAFWLTTAGALLISALAFGAMSSVSFVINNLLLHRNAPLVGFFGLMLLWLWPLSLPLPIWMALLYRRNRGAAQGDDLQRRLQAWSDQNSQQTALEPLPAEG